MSPSDTSEGQTGIRGPVPTLTLTSEHRGGSAEDLRPSDHFKDSDRHPQVLSKLQDKRPANTKSCLVNDKKQVGKKNKDSPLKFVCVN